MKTSQTLAMVFLTLLLGLVVRSQAAALPDFSSDEEADKWLRENLLSYGDWAREVDRRGGYLLTAPNNGFSGNFHDEYGRRCIALPDYAKGVARLSPLIFHVADAFHEPDHLYIDADTVEGRVPTAEEFAKRHLQVIYQDLEALRQALLELEKTVGKLPDVMFSIIGLPTKGEHQLPPFEEWLPKQNRTYYEEWFMKQLRPAK